MKAYSIALAALVLLLSLILSTWLSRAQVEGRPITWAPSASVSARVSSSSQAFRDLHADKELPFNKVDSSFRRIPPSTSNPTQNKFNHP